MVECTGLENLRTERFREFESHLLRQIRSIAQPGSASALGAEGHRFESYYSDQLEETKNGYVWSVDYNWGKYIGRCFIGTYGMGPY